MNCPTCHKEIPSEASSCPACGPSFDDATRLKSHNSPADKPLEKESRSSTSFDSIDNARFVPGAMLAERYRIVGLLGKGGMGEVYRADDLKLSQPVALKFLPAHLLSDGAALARFHREVRVARQISHKNVCRVYDIGEIDGRHFLSMEFIKGEELSSLVHRIGRLPSDKAVQIARQICAGLAAAHDNGVLHRDLKPANVMIDEHGNARITDFGLAGLAEEFSADELAAGTPGYMAPEQLEGKEQTARSDIYSLGLVLYELFTGRKAFEAPTLGALIDLRRSNTLPTTPTSIVKDLDPVIEKVIDRCIQKDPANRPSSALQVAAALPGGDPIAAALAAGETPSPEMVAAAPKEGGLRPPVAMALLAVFFVLLAAVVLFAGRNRLYHYVPFDKSPDVLRETARDIARRAGYSEATDSADWFTPGVDMMNYIRDHDQSPDRLVKIKTVRPSAISFVYRQSPRYLETVDGQVNANEPPLMVSGMVSAVLDTRGLLRLFVAVPKQVEDHAVTTPTEIDWSIFFTAAGLNQAEFRPAESRWTPVTAFDRRTAWEGAYPDNPQLPIRIEAASYLGRAVYFEIVHPWDRPERDIAFQVSTGLKVLIALIIALLSLAGIAGALLTLKNIRLGRGDRRGAFRLAHFVFWVSVVGGLFGVNAHHVPTALEFFIILTTIAWALFGAAFFWVVYMALEPFVRRRWPERIISWTRLLAGDFRDPMVGRDLLIGALFGIFAPLHAFLRYQIPGWLGYTPGVPPTQTVGSNMWLGAGSFLPALGSQIVFSLLLSFVILLLILMLSLFFRRDRLAFVIGWAVWVLVVFLANVNQGAPVLDLILVAIGGIFIIAPIWRYGLLAVVSLGFFGGVSAFPITTNFTAWYATGFVLYLALLVALAVYGFYTSLAGQPLFGGKLFEE